VLRYGQKLTASTLVFSVGGRKEVSRNPLLVVTLCVTRFNIRKLDVVSTQHIYVFCMDLRTSFLYTALRKCFFITETEYVTGWYEVNH